MAEIGQKGFAATVAKNWGGSKEEYLKHQRTLANQAVVEALADIQLRAELAKGKDVACAELPCLEDYEPQSWQDRVSRRKDTGAELPW